MTAGLFGLTAPLWIGAACLVILALALAPVLTTDAITRARQGDELAS